MANFLGKFLDYIGIEESDNDENELFEEDTFEEDTFEEEALKINNRGKKRNQGNVVSLPNAATMKMIVFHPSNYEDAQTIVDNLRSRKPVVVNMEDLELDCAQRVLDFMLGSIYALDGSIYKVSKGIFIVAPTNYDIVGNPEEESDETMV